MHSTAWGRFGGGRIPPRWHKGGSTNAPARRSPSPQVAEEPPPRVADRRMVEGEPVRFLSASEDVEGSALRVVAAIEPGHEPAPVEHGEHVVPVGALLRFLVHLPTRRRTPTPSRARPDTPGGDPRGRSSSPDRRTRPPPPRGGPAPRWRRRRTGCVSRPPEQASVTLTRPVAGVSHRPEPRARSSRPRPPRPRGGAPPPSTRFRSRYRRTPSQLGVTRARISGGTTRSVRPK